MKKNWIMPFILFLNILAVMQLSCTHKIQFDSLNQVSYITDVAPIINTNCMYSGCHGNANTKKFSLLTYSNLLAAGIEPGNPNKSKVYTTITSLNSSNVMPQKPYDSLTDKQIQLIYIWIGQGAKNN
ncbi:MAG: hypothetical protein IT237_01020 [Bacteroidia bacterium]|nr:hypothetical protein [Bacteroidia bacterium]